MNKVLLHQLRSLQCKHYCVHRLCSPVNAVVIILLIDEMNRLVGFFGNSTLQYFLSADEKGDVISVDKR